MSDTLEVGRIGWWRFTDGSLLDESGNNSTLTVVGSPTYSNNEVIFNNTSYMYAYTGLTDNALVGFSVWFNNTATGGVILSLSSINLSESKPEIIINKMGINSIRIYRQYEKVSTHTIPSGMNHICGSTKTGIYLNGVKITTWTPAYDGVNNVIWLNNGPSISPTISAGKIDEVSLYNRELTVAECIELYNRGVNYEVDTTPPSFNSVSIDTITYNSANLNVNSNEDGKVYYKILPRNATAPTSTELKANPTGQTNVTANTTSIISLTGLTSNANLDCYVVAEDTVPNLQLEPTKIEFATLPLIKIGTPYSSIPSGTYTSEKTVPLSCETLGADIRYTLDGTEPTQSSLLYSSPIVISTSTTIKAKAFKSGGYIDSDILVLEMTIIPVPPTTPTKYIQPPKITVKENIIMIDSHYKIYYTTDGSYPNDTSLQYTVPISMPTNATIITAIAYSEQNLSFSYITQHTLYPQHTTTIYPPQ